MNLAVIMVISSKEVLGKIYGIWFCIFSIVALGFEHCVANMYLIPVGMWHGADVTVKEFLVDNLTPVSLGNFTGAVLFVGVFYTYIH